MLNTMKHPAVGEWTTRQQHKKKAANWVSVCGNKLCLLPHIMHKINGGKARILELNAEGKIVEVQKDKQESIFTMCGGQRHQKH